jgi:hypothetical protein
VAAVVTILLMLAISLIKTYRTEIQTMLEEMGWWFRPRAAALAVERRQPPAS